MYDGKLHLREKLCLHVYAKTFLSRLFNIRSMEQDVVTETEHELRWRGALDCKPDPECTTGCQNRLEGGDSRNGNSISKCVSISDACQVSWTPFYWGVLGSLWSLGNRVLVRKHAEGNALFFVFRYEQIIEKTKQLAVRSYMLSNNVAATASATQASVAR